MGREAQASDLVSEEEKTQTGQERHSGFQKHAIRPFLHDFLLSLRGLAVSLLAGLAVFITAIPVSTSAVGSVSVLNESYVGEQLRYQFFAPDLSQLIGVACSLYGAVLALVAFRFLLSKTASTAFFSVGLSRTKLCVSRFLAALVCILLGIGIPLAISLAINIASLGLSTGEVEALLYILSGCWISAIAAFALTLIAISRSGTFFEALMFTAALLLGVTAVLWSLGVLSNTLLVGNAAGAVLYGQSQTVLPSYVDGLSWINPLLFFSEQLAEYQQFSAATADELPAACDWLFLLGWICACVALLFIAVLLFCRRRGEQAETAGRAPVFSLFSTALLGLAVCAAAVELIGSLDLGMSLIAGMALFVVVSLVMLFGPLRGGIERKVPFALVGTELIVLLAFIGVLWTGGLGYSSYIPDSEDIESVEITYVGSPSYLAGSFSGYSSESAYYCLSYRSYSQESSIEIVRSLHLQIADSARDLRATDFTDFESSVIPYDVVICYTLRDGSQVVRYYNQATVGELSALLTLSNDEHSLALDRAVITGDLEGLSEEEQEQIEESISYQAYRNGYIYLADGALNRILQVECTDEDREELLQALAADISQMDAAERALPSNKTEAVLMFTLVPESDVSSFGFSFNNAVSYITKDYSETMAWLEAHGYIDALGGELNPLIIEQLTFQVDDPYASINEVTMPVSRYFMSYRTETASSFWVTQDFGSLYVIDDQNEIAEILPLLRTGCYMTGGYLVEAKLSGIEAYVYFYLPAELAPDDL